MLNGCANVILKSWFHFVEFSHIDVLINNAGVMKPRLPKATPKTDDGFERQFGVNHLGMVQLVHLWCCFILFLKKFPESWCWEKLEKKSIFYYRVRCFYHLLEQRFKCFLIRTEMLLETLYVPLEFCFKHDYLPETSFFWWSKYEKLLLWHRQHKSSLFSKYHIFFLLIEIGLIDFT